MCPCSSSVPSTRSSWAGSPTIATAIPTTALRVVETATESDCPPHRHDVHTPRTGDALQPGYSEWGSDAVPLPDERPTVDQISVAQASKPVACGRLGDPDRAGGSLGIRGGLARQCREQ